MGQPAIKYLPPCRGGTTGIAYGAKKSERSKKALPTMGGVFLRLQGCFV